MKKEQLVEIIIDHINLIRENLTDIGRLINDIRKCVEEEQFIPHELYEDIIQCLELHELERNVCKELYASLYEEEITGIDKLKIAVTELEIGIKQDAIKSSVSKFYQLHSIDAEIEKLLSEKKEILDEFVKKENLDDIENFIEFANTIAKMNEMEAGELYTSMTKMMPIFGTELSAHAFVTKDIYLHEEALGESTTSILECGSTNIEVIDEGTTCIMENTDTFLPFEYDYGGLFIEKSQREDKKFGVKDFKNDIINSGYTKLEKRILQAIYKYNFITLGLISEMINEVPEVILSKALEHLFNRGYLRIYRLGKYGEFYCASSKCEKAFCSRDARSFLEIKWLEHNAGKNVFVNKESQVAIRLIWAKLLEKEFDHRKDIKFNSHTEIFAEAFCVGIYTNSSMEKIDCIFGAVWWAQEECLEFVNKVKYFIQDNNIQRIIIAGINSKQATSLAEEILKRYENANKYRIIIYALEEDCFYKYEDGERATIEEIWTSDNVVKIDSDNKSQEIESPKDIKNPELTRIDITMQEEAEEKFIKSVIPKKENEVDEKMSLVEIENVLQNTYRMISEEKIYCATAYLKVYSERSVVLQAAWNKLAYAVNDPIKRCRYSTDKIYDIFFDEQSITHDYFLVATVLRTFFYNHIEYDYSIKSFYEGNMRTLSIVKECPNLSNLLHILMEFKIRQHKGIDVYADYRMKASVQLESNIEKVKREARDFYNEKILGKASESASHKRFIETKKLIFAQDNYIALCLKSIFEGDMEMIPLMEEFLLEFFIKNESPIDVVNIDLGKIDDFIDEYWNKAGEKMLVAKKTSNLMSSLRQNLFNAIANAISILCMWITYIERLNNQGMDERFIQYKKIRNQLLSEICESINYYNKKRITIERIDEYAGNNVLITVLEEMKKKIEGNFDENTIRFFYIDFLKSDLILLNEDYMPVLDMDFRDIRELDLGDRILKHANSELMTFEKRLHEIFKEYGDDYGSAKLILDYLGEEGNSLIEFENYDLMRSIDYGKRGVEKEKLEFIEDLELMQSYGQIDNSIENKKEKYHQVVIEFYEFAKQTNNFGFFKNVTNAFRKKIKEDAKSRENSLIKELEEYRTYLKSNPDRGKKLIKLDKVQKMLDVQNYTVAEDLLSRIKRDETDSNIEVLPRDYLEDFIDRFDYYKNKVADSSRSLSSIASTRIRNKDDKGGRRLVENWPANGQKLPADKLRTLLQVLGFLVGDIKEQTKLGKIDNYFVFLSQPSNGRIVNFKHPISALGSKAIEDGFRIVFMFGKTDADRLIAGIKELGNAKHTLIILDYALALQERRTLARKLKEESSGKIFGIIDRVLIMYLAENYNEEYVNQMLMSIMMPFSYYQPYVWDSANVMPPEIFMGRDMELAKIESPTGVNIVYGGRQLGKSALLRMAKNNIDYDENGNRAILVDIKGLDYKKAAKKITHTLYDDGVLEQDLEIEDWDELARLIQKRLKQDENRIPYLLLLLDEADAFIESCETINYQPFDALKDVQSIGVNRFKFVIAGLRNIVRFKRETALGNNSVLTHLESMTVKPFEYKEARKLLEEPLYYLGLRFKKDKDALISLIFASANYFPGLIQLYCAKLVEAMRKGDYAGYNEVSAPIYQVEKEHIKKVLSEEGFRQQIREKFEITLKLDEDNYYYIIALLLSKLYHENGYNNGYSANDILKEGIAYEIPKIMSLKLERLIAFMEELCELNILRKTSEDVYLFNRYSFFQMMGSHQEVDDKLMEYMEE